MNFKRYIEQFYGDGLYREATVLQYDETNLEFSQTEKVLLYYLDRDEKMNMGQIVEILQIPNSTANYVVVKLTKKGLLERKKSSEDRRVIEVSITEMGREVNEKIMRNLQKRFDIVIRRSLESLEIKLAPEELSVVKKALLELFNGEQ